MHDCAVIITSMLRPSVEEAVLSVYRQEFAGTIQVVLGIDRKTALEPAAQALLERLRAACPPRRTLTVIDPGYSTAAINGGLYSNAFGGMMPAIASFAADSRFLCYLDDDDWYGPEHVATLFAAMQGRPWAHSLSWYVNPANDEPMCIDHLESVGPGRGAYRNQFGGFVRPSCLMLDKLQCAEMLHLWGVAMFAEGNGSDRAIFDALMKHRPSWGESRLASVFYRINPQDPNHGYRLAYAQAMGYDIARVPNLEAYTASTAAGETWSWVYTVLREPPHV